MTIKVKTKTPFHDLNGKIIYLDDKLIMDEESVCVIEWDGYKYVLNFDGEIVTTDESNNNRLRKI